MWEILSKNRRSCAILPSSILDGQRFHIFWKKPHLIDNTLSSTLEQFAIERRKKSGFLCFCFVIGLENSRHSLNQSDAKLKTIYAFVSLVGFSWFYLELSLALTGIFLSSSGLLWLICFWLCNTQSKCPQTFEWIDVAQGCCWGQRYS